MKQFVEKFPNGIEKQDAVEDAVDSSDGEILTDVGTT